MEESDPPLDMDQPRLLTPLLREPGPGAIGVRGFLPRGSAPDDIYTANFANLVVRPGVVEYDFPDIPAADAPLRKGRNELMLVVDEIFGGWAVMGRLADRQGLSVDPR